MAWTQVVCSGLNAAQGEELEVWAIGAVPPRQSFRLGARLYAGREWDANLHIDAWPRLAIDDPARPTDPPK
jgi:hypothetical protein